MAIEYDYKINVIGYEKSHQFTHSLNLHFKMLVSLEV